MSMLSSDDDRMQPADPDLKEQPRGCCKCPYCGKKSQMPLRDHDCPFKPRVKP